MKLIIVHYNMLYRITKVKAVLYIYMIICIVVMVTHKMITQSSFRQFHSCQVIHDTK